MDLYYICIRSWDSAVRHAMRTLIDWVSCGGANHLDLFAACITRNIENAHHSKKIRKTMVIMVILMVMLVHRLHMLKCPPQEFERMSEPLYVSFGSLYAIFRLSSYTKYHRRYTLSSIFFQSSANLFERSVGIGLRVRVSIF